MDEIRTIQKKSLVKKVTSPQELCSTKLKETLKTLKTGANDVVVVQQSDGLTYKATPLYIRIGKFSSWVRTVQGKRKDTFVKHGTISTAKLLINNRKALENIEFIISDSGDEVLMRRTLYRDNCPSERNSTKLEEISKIFRDDDLKSMNLNYGKNEAIFNGGEDVGNITIRFSIYLYHQSNRLIFTDIDGTITKSDVKGFVHGSLENYLPSVKGLRFKSEVHHEGVVEFFNKAADNGYTIIYLTARPIDFDTQTRKYLFNSLQDRDGGYSLPESALFSGAKVSVEECGVTERVSYNPSIVKSSTIQTIIDLFDVKEKAVCGAFGNKDTDTVAYCQSSISPENVYLIDECGSIVQVNSSRKTSYNELSNNIDSILPPLPLKS